MRQIPKRLNNDGPGSMIIRDGGKPVAEMLAYTSSERDDTAAEFIERWNAFEPDGEAAQLRAEVERLKAALEALTEHSANVNTAFYVIGTSKAMKAAMGGQKALLDAARAALGKGAA